MELFLDFFENLASWQKLAWIVSCLSLAWLLEFLFPLVTLPYKKWKHAGVNLIFLSTSLLINILFGIGLTVVFNLIEYHQFGILNWLEFSFLTELIIAIFFLDFVAQYLVHVLLHKVGFMWRFHMIHHSDTKVDATTGTRHHPGDYLMREIFGMMAIVILGAPLSFYVFYKILTIFFTYTGHANIRVPKWIDKPLSYIFMTPNMHKFHHHFERPWTDTNYGNVFSIWDRMFGTWVYDDPKKVKYGLDVLDDSTDEKISYQFKIPFDKSIKTDY
ncbi:MAG: sterol desaturase/sphingolipid hydroxylase (fatty acid hydroxylase superfamily) [Patiriisocius sp.]|jgi:sterol desaturase/sphingolipid hydroxylase (fatty acid hydroxylase superfamily)